jgi:ubiquinone/menaquinone biosynthesis C-methylase UbiE
MNDRGYLGTTPLGAERDDDAYLDFVEGARVFTLTGLSDAMNRRSEAAIAEAERALGRKLTAIEEIKAVLDPIPVVASRNRFSRTVQEMMWQGVIDTYRKREPELLRELALADRLGPGSVEYDPNFPYPDYFSRVDFHIQPGGYFADPLAGYIYHYGTKVFYTGRNNNDDIHRELVEATPAPEDGRVERILDLACGIGQAATWFKQRFPQAEVWGLDLSAPMVRYAHKRAVDLGLEVHFTQRLAEDTKFPDNHFDIIFVYLLFHEVPWPVSQQIVREVHRILRLGGVFAIFDFPSRPGQQLPPLAAYARYFDSHDNSEPYAAEFVQADFHGELRRYFRYLNENWRPEIWIPNRVAIK